MGVAFANGGPDFRSALRSTSGNRGVIVLSPGQRLRALREEFGYTIRDVEAASIKIAARRQTDDYAIALSRLSDIETKGVIPSIYRLYTLATIYRRDIRELMSWYGVDLNEMASDLDVVDPPKSHVAESLAPATMMEMPVRMDPGFDEHRTCNLGRLIERWGTVPVAFLRTFTKTEFTYAYVGNEDFTMYPILPPGSFLQIDESKNEVVNGAWRSEYERPIYLVETREGYTCSWCALKHQELVLQSHPLSPVPIRSACLSQGCRDYRTGGGGRYETR